MDDSEKLEPLTADSLIVEAEERISWRALKAYYRSKGIKCYNCPAAEIETFREGSVLHKFDLEAHLKDINELAKNHPWDGFAPGLFGRVMAGLGLAKKATE